jgi:hypothetical protein
VTLLGARGSIVAIGVAAGLALWNGTPHGPALASIYLILSTIAAGVAAATSLLPGRPPPGTRLAAFLMVAAFNLGWLLYLWRRGRQA